MQESPFPPVGKPVPDGPADAKGSDSYSDDDDKDDARFGFDIAELKKRQADGDEGGERKKGVDDDNYEDDFDVWEV